MEYDRGKQKKVRGKEPDEWDEGGNRFQDAWNSRQHGGRHQHKQVRPVTYVGHINDVRNLGGAAWEYCAGVKLQPLP